VQLHDDVDRHAAERLDELGAHGVQRRGRRPGRRVKDGRPRRVEPESLQHRFAPECAVDEAVHLRHADQANRRAVGIDGAAGNEVAQAPLVDEEQPVPFAHRAIGRIEAVFAADAVEDLHPGGLPQQRRPHEVRGNVGVEPHDRGAARMNEPNGGRIRVLRRADRLVIDRRHPVGVFGRREVVLDARIRLHGAKHRRHHREVDRCAGVDEDPAAIAAPGQRLVEAADAMQKPVHGFAHTGAPTVATVRAAAARRPERAAAARASR
jgi:hypothetical protein